MKRDCRFALALSLVICLGFSIAQPTTLLCQQNPAQETYNGDPMCRTARGVYPHPTYQPDPDYDDKDRKKKIQGEVLLSTIVTKEGRTADLKVTKSLTPNLDKQAIKAVSQWRFDPVIQDGKACPTRIVVEVSFHLY